MNIFLPVFGIAMLVVGFFFVKELMKPPQRIPPSSSQSQTISPLSQEPSQIQQTERPQRKNYRQAYSQLQKEMEAKKEEKRLSPQAMQHLSKPRDVFKTVDTDFQQSKAKMWGMNPLKQPVNPEEYDTEVDAAMYWNRKQPTIYALLAFVSFVLFLMLGV